MSLSPQDYERSIGISETEHGSCLVYLDGTLVGQKPSGCDNWHIDIKDGYLLSLDDRIYPPIWSYEKNIYISGDLEESKQMYKQALEIIDNYNKDRTY
jgi:hypothetical protein